MPQDFQQGFQAGSAVFAPFMAATQQGQALQIAQQQEQAHRLFQQQQLQKELDARSKLAQASNLFRAKLAADQLAAAAEQAKADRVFQAQRDETRFDNESALRQEANDLVDRRADERQENTTSVASALFGQVKLMSDGIKEALQLTSEDQERALAVALQLTGVDIRRTPGEDVVAYLNKVSQKNPEVIAEYSAQLQAIQQAKSQSPDVLNMQTQGQILGNIFQNVMRSGNVDPSFLEAVAPSASGAADPDDPAAILDALGVGTPPGLPAPDQPSVDAVAPATTGAAGVLQNVFSPVVESSAPSLPDVGNFLFGTPSVTADEVPSLKDFAIQSGVAEKDFQDLVNNAPTDSGAQKSLRDLKQSKLKSEAARNRATQVNPFGFDSGIPIESGPRFR